MFLKKVLIASVILLLFMVQAGLAQTDSQASQDDSTSQFMRIRKDDGGQMVSLDVAVVRYHGTHQKKRVTVDLVSALHVGEKSYYHTLNQAFKNYDAVLYELVAPREHKERIGASEKNRSILSGMQGGLAGMLGLAFQLEEIDYQASNFVHADLSPDEFADSMADRGETVLDMMVRLFAASMVASYLPDAQDGNLEFFLAFLEPAGKRREIRLRRVFAKQFKSTEFISKAVDNGDGSQGGSTLIGARNDRALAVLKEQMAKGEKRLAVFYGGGHMYDMEKKLRRDFEMKKTSVRWIAAWNLVY